MSESRINLIKAASEKLARDSDFKRAAKKQARTRRKLKNPRSDQKRIDSMIVEIEDEEYVRPETRQEYDPWKDAFDHWEDWN